jgi:hypothetical protein
MARFRPLRCQSLTSRAYCSLPLTGGTHLSGHLNPKSNPQLGFSRPAPPLLISTCAAAPRPGGPTPLLHQIHVVARHQTRAPPVLPPLAYRWSYGSLERQASPRAARSRPAPPLAATSPVPPILHQTRAASHRPAPPDAASFLIPTRTAGHRDHWSY